MDGEASSKILPTTSSDSWPMTDLPDLSSSTLNSVFASEPLASHNDFNNYLQSLGDHDDPLLSPVTVASITDILVPGESLNKGGSQCKVDQSFGLESASLPSLFTSAHEQRTEHDASSTTVRPAGADIVKGSSNVPQISDVLLSDIEKMQDDPVLVKDKLSTKKSAISEGLQKIKAQLEKSEKTIVGPAVVTEFIDHSSAMMFSDDLDDISKCSVDSAENVVAKDFTVSPRRSGRKTTRLFEIVAPKSKSKKNGGLQTEVENAQKSQSESKKEENTRKGANTVAKKDQGSSGDDLPKRRSLRGQQLKEEDKKGDGSNVKGDGPKVKDDGPKVKGGGPKVKDNGPKGKGDGPKAKDDSPKGKGRFRGMNTPKSSSESESSPRKRRGRGDSRIKSENEKDNETEKITRRRSKLDDKTDNKSPSKRPGRGFKRGGKEEENEENNDDKDVKNSKKDDTKTNKTDKTKSKKEDREGKKEDVKKDADKSSKEEGKTDESEEEDFSSDESIPDDGELSDDCSEFDPDEDPNRPWCVCRKPHGNRFMICCDTCEDWFHGDCVGITQADGREMEKHGEEWMCPKCKRKLQALSKELKERERLARLQNRLKSDGERSSSDEKDGSDKIRQKLLKILAKEPSLKHEIKSPDVKERKKKVDTDTDDDDDDEEEPTTPAKKKSRPIEDKEAREARKLEEEIEWKRRLKEMKARQAKAELELKRRESIEGQMTFDKIGSQKFVKIKAEGSTEVKQETSSKKPPLKSINDKADGSTRDRRKSDSSSMDAKHKAMHEAARRISVDISNKKQLKREISDEREVSPKKHRPGEAVSSKKVRITPTPKATKQPGQQKYCIVCNRPTMKNAVYCNKDCITSYTKESLRLIAEDKQKRLGIKVPEVKSPTQTESGKGTTISPATSSTDVKKDGDERITVLERSTGKVLAGLMAPTKSNIYSWVEGHPTFEVFRPANKSTTSLKEKKDLTEVIRNNVKKSLKDTILARCKDFNMEVKVEEVTKICHTIEEEIVKMYGDTGQKYKTKYRSLIFNLKDPKNRNLYKQVVLGDLTPSKLVHMSPEQLASAELARWREKEAKHHIEMIKKREEEEALATKHAVKKTHKGEVELEKEADDMRNLETHIEAPEEQKEPAPDEESTPMHVEDTTGQHNSHLFDLNCKICTGKQLQPGQQPILPHVSTTVIQAIPESSMPSPSDSPDEDDLRRNSPDTIEDLTRSPINIPLPSKEKFEAVWKGFIMMQSVAKFASSAYRVSGPCDKLLQLLPDTIQVCGRINPEQVWDYLFQLKGTHHKKIDLLRFEMAADEEKAGYVSLYSYFYTRKRIGVVGNCHSGVKDMYLVPLASHDPIPPELKPFDGPGMPNPRPHMLIGIVVKNKSATSPQKRSKSSNRSTTPEPMSKKCKKHSKDRSRKEEKKRSKKNLEKPYEDIIFGKHKTNVPETKNTPSESSSSYTPDLMTPPGSSTTPGSSQESKMDEAQLMLEEKLQKQKEELLRLQAEVQAKLEKSKPAMLPPALSTVMAPIMSKPSEVSNCSTGAPSAAVSVVASQTTSTISLSTSASSFVAVAPMMAAGMMVPSPSSLVQAQAVSSQVVVPGKATSLAQDTSFAQTIPSVEVLTSVQATSGQPTMASVQAVLIPSTSQPLVMPAQAPISSTTVESNKDTLHVPVVPVQIISTTSQSSPAVSHLAVNKQILDTSLKPGDIPPSTLTPTAVHAPKSEPGKSTADDEPYDPEDDLDLDIKDPEPEAKVAETVTKTPEAKKQSTGDEPYDPEDDFVLDLIEDISLPSSLKKIEKPNLPFPLEITKKVETKMPELPPIRLPDKQFDRRSGGFASFTSPNLVDPRSNASPRLQPVSSQGSTTAVPAESPTLRAQSQLTSPSHASGLDVTGSKPITDPRVPETGTSSISSTSQTYQTPVSTATYSQEASGHWKPDDRYGDPRGQSAADSGGQGTAGNLQGNYYQDRYQSYSGDYYSGQTGSSYQDHWRQGSFSGDQGHAGQSSHDSNWNDRNRYGRDSRDWSGRERDYDSWQRGYQSGQYDYKNDKYNADYRSNQNYDHYGMNPNDPPAHRIGDRRGSRGHYRGHPRDGDRGRGSQWR